MRSGYQLRRCGRWCGVGRSNPGVVRVLTSAPRSQEFNLEKLQLLEQEKAKIRKEYERKEGQVEVKKKM